MSFLTIYLTISLVILLLINSLYAIFNKMLIEKKENRSIVESGYGCALIAALSLLLVSSNSSPVLHIFLGNFSICIIYILLILTMLIINIVGPFKLKESALLVTFSTLGLILMIQTSHLIGLYLGVELYSLSAYILASGAEGVYSSKVANTHTVNKPSISAGLKYFLLSALSSGVLIAGISIVYACTGDLTINGLSRILNMYMHTYLTDLTVPTISYKQDILFTMLGMGLILSTLAFKIGAAPFHFWVPDVYSKVSLFVNFYLISVPKIGILYTLIKISLVLPFSTEYSSLILIFSILSLIVGAIGGLVQLKTTRLLAYSSISHAGYILLALYAAHIPHNTGILANIGSVCSTMHIYSIVLYLMIYSLMTVNMFTILYCIDTYNTPTLKAANSKLAQSSSPFNRKYISGLKGLSALNPFLAASMAVTLLSMAGVPPLAGFVAKLSVYVAVLDSGALMPAIFAVLCSVITAVYYLRLIKIAYFYNSPFSNNDKVISNSVNVSLEIKPEVTTTKSENITVGKSGTLFAIDSNLEAANAVTKSLNIGHEKPLPLTHFSSIVISLSTLILIFFPILNPSLLYLYLNY